MGLCGDDTSHTKGLCSVSGDRDVDVGNPCEEGVMCGWIYVCVVDYVCGSLW